MNDRLGIRPALAACGLALLLAACAPTDPLETLARARAAYEVEALNWVAIPPGPDAAEDAPAEAAISLRVTDTGAPAALDCLTIDVVYYGEQGPDGPELAREPLELELTGILDTGGTLERAARVSLPEGATTIAIAPHAASGEALRSLCEARSVLDDAS